MDIGKNGHRRGRRERGLQEHRELVDEIALGGFGLRAPEVDSGWKVMPFDAEGSAEKTNFVWFRFEIRVVRVRENKIENRQTCFDEVDLVGSAVADILAFQTPVQPAREHM